MSFELPSMCRCCLAQARGALMVMALGGCLSGQALGDSDMALPLPQWSAEDLEALARQGGPPGLGILLPPDTTFLPPLGDSAGFLHAGPRLADGPPNVFPEGGLLPQDMALFLPDSILRSYQPAHSAPSPTPAASLRELTFEPLSACYLAPANEYLLDPQGLVPEIAGEQIQRLLEFHAHDARIRAYVMVIDRDQKLPHQARLDRIACGSLAKGASCLLVYPLGEPWRARVFLSKPIYAATTQAYLADMVADCGKDAMLTNDAGEQLHRFAVSLSTRLFWLEKVSARALPARQPASLQEVVPDGAGVVLSEDAPVYGGSRSLSETAMVVLLMIGAVAGTAFSIKRLHVRRAQRHLMRVWILPDPDTVQRFGGPFCGGSGASISYKA